MVMLYLAICLLILGYLGTTLIAWQSIAKRDFLTYTALILVLLGAVGAIWITVDTSRTADQLVAKSNKISELSLKLYSSSMQLADTQQKLRTIADNQTESQLLLRKKSDEIALLNRDIAENQRQLRKKSDEIAVINQNIVAQVTGGDSHGELLAFYPGKDNIVDIFFLNDGKYPLYDVSISIKDREKTVENYVANKSRHLGSLAEFVNINKDAVNTFNIGNIGPNQSKQLWLTIPNTDKRSYFITIVARNGIIEYSLSYRKIEGNWKMALRGTGNNGVLKEYYDPDFPRDNNGNIEW